MAEPGILFDHVWKKFRRGELHDSLRDLLPAVTRGLFRRSRPNDVMELQQREFWALSDVYFEVKPGEALGIIGANGAGKSTILKTLNRILRPTRGYCEVRGRAGSLIEVSAGFHQDLTGRQNVYLQGAIMGMRQSEIDTKFDEIVDFAGLADFIDTPVKRYSSGMNARLGFSVAAHLDPDVLIIDEVLAVGDFAFQERAFGRIQEMVQSGIPVVLVSHQLDRISTLCSSVILLEHGRVVKHDTPEQCIATYIMESQRTMSGADKGPTPIHIRDLHVLSPLPVRSGDWVRYRIRGEVEDWVAGGFDPYKVRVRSAQSGTVVFSTVGANCGLSTPPPGTFEAEIELQMNVEPGIYALETLVEHTGRAVNSSAGPMAYIQVVGGPAFEGKVQMHAAMRLVEVNAREQQAVGLG